MKKFLGLVLVLATALSAAPYGMAYAEVDSKAATAPGDATATDMNDAKAVVKNFYVQLLESMKNSDSLGYAGRYKKLDPAVRADFDMPYMTRVALGTVWSKTTEAQQKQLIAAFTEFSVASYAGQFKAYDGESFTVDSVKPAPGGLMVLTKLQPKDHPPVDLDYLMQKDDDGKWRVVDVFLSGSISQLAARRSEFTSIANRDGIAALVDSLGEKSRKMGPS